MSLFSIEVKNVENEISKKFSNSLLFTFFISELIFHWQFLIGLFSSEIFIYQNFQISKLEYLFNILFIYGPWWLPLLTWGLPFLVTWIFIWVLPKYLFLPAFEISEKYEAEKMKIKFKLEKEINKLEADSEEEKLRKKEAEIKKNQAEKELTATDPETRWQIEVEDFRKRGHAQKFQDFITKYYQGHKYLHQFQSTEIAFFDALGLIEISKGDRVIADVTEKGKFFLREISMK